MLAQRRPVLSDRQLRRNQSFDAVATVTAQRRPVLSDRQLEAVPHGGPPLDLRSTKAGPVGPATLRARRRGGRRTRPLNEGRSCRTGNSYCFDVGARDAPHRSTKAGPVGPATHVSATRQGARYARAQRRPVLSDRQLLEAGGHDADAQQRAAQRRPVLSDRQLVVCVGCRAILVSRSTKAGPVGPATRLDRLGSWWRQITAQRRPVLSDRQLQSTWPSNGPTYTAQRRPVLSDRQLCRAGQPPRAHRRRAQRRPVLSDRQLIAHLDGRHQGPPRSTKAGPVGPATLQLITHSSTTATAAQRRPVLSDRQLAAVWAVTELAGSHAQRRPVLSDRQLHDPPARHRRKYSTLNEGRSCRTGNSRYRISERIIARRRSTKAGPVGPATRGGTRPGRRGGRALNEGRSCRTGNSGQTCEH